MISAPNVSVIMSVYNGERYLDQAILSILNQSLEDFEFVIINDGSMDKTSEIIEKYMQLDERIIFVSRENKGLVKSLNEAIELSRAPYIARMDADDIALPERLRNQFQFLEANQDIGICGTITETFGESVKTKRWRLPEHHDQLKPLLIFSVPFSHPSVMMRRDTMRLHNLSYNEGFEGCEDYKLWWDAAGVTKFANIQQTHLRYRKHRESVTRKAESGDLKKRYNIVSKVHREVLMSLNISPNKEYTSICFDLMNNVFISKSDICPEKVRIFFDMIIARNKELKIFNNRELSRYLSTKFFRYILLNRRASFAIKLGMAFDVLFLKGAIVTIQNFCIPITKLVFKVRRRHHNFK